VVSAEVRVLIVDDVESFRRAASQVVEAAEGFVVVGLVATGEEALRFLSRQSASLVLLDVHMPGMGGVSAAEAICATFPETTVVLLSVHRRPALPTNLSARLQFCAKDEFGPEELEQSWRRGIRAQERS
jgi:two-component system, NarL family, invasion response regulator UvrY